MEGCSDETNRIEKTCPERVPDRDNDGAPVRGERVLRRNGRRGNYTPEGVLARRNADIRRRHDVGERTGEIARIHGISAARVSQIIHGRNRGNFVYLPQETYDLLLRQAIRLGLPPSTLAGGLLEIVLSGQVALDTLAQAVNNGRAAPSPLTRA